MAGCLVLCMAFGTSAQQKTYCNPINVDYGYTPFPSFAEWGKHRATADPVIVTYKETIIYSVPTNGVTGTAAIC